MAVSRAGALRQRAQGSIDGGRLRYTKRALVDSANDGLLESSIEERDKRL